MPEQRYKLGFAGIGLMGRPLVLRLLAAGCEVKVWNRDPAKLQPVAELAPWFAHPPPNWCASRTS